MNDYLVCPYLRQVLKLEWGFATLATGKVETKVKFGLTSLTRKKTNPAKLLAIVQSEW